MIKKILLAAIFMPCIIHTMDQRVERYEDDKRVMYWRGDLKSEHYEKVVYNKKDQTSYSYEKTSTGGGEGSAKGGKSVSFLALESAYTKQQREVNSNVE